MGGSRVYHQKLAELDTMGEKLNYQYFGLEADASERDIDNAYRKLARKMHPDKNGGTEEAKKKIPEAAGDAADEKKDEVKEEKEKGLEDEEKEKDEEEEKEKEKEGEDGAGEEKGAEDDAAEDDSEDKKKKNKKGENIEYDPK